MLLAPALCLALFDSPRALGADVVVKMTSNLAFNPSTSAINAGDSVTWTNISTIAHNTTSDNPLWASPTSGLGLTFTHQFPTAGSFPYECTIHVFEGMTGTITVSAAVATPPVVAITSPANGASFFAPAGFTLSATASSSSATISQVQFFEGSNSLGVVKTSPYSVGVTGLAAGSFVFSAVATDSNGLAATNSVSVTVATATPPSLGAGTFIPPATFQFSISIQAGEEYAVDRTIDFSSWLPLATNTATASPVIFTDTISTNRAFYRARLLTNP
jgi:plastocyanin